MRRTPVASEIVRHARRDLVHRLDRYEIEHTELFHDVIALLDTKIMPIIVRHAISGFASFNTEDPLLNDSLALAMLLDVFSERGFRGMVDIHRQDIPGRVDLESGEIICRVKKVFRICVRFPGSEIRRG